MGDKTAMISAAVTAVILGFVQLASKTTTYYDSYAIVEHRTIRSGIAQRERTLVTFNQDGRNKYWIAWSDHDTYRTVQVELPAGTNLGLPGDILTRAEIDAKKGRSLLGKGWDFILKPRKRP